MTAAITTRRPVDPTEPIRWTPGERFHHLIEETASRLAGPDALGHHAVSLPSDSISYPELIGRSRQLASRLAAAGVGPGDRVGVLGGAPFQAYPALLGISLLGATAVPMDPSFPDDRIAFIIDDADVALTLVDEGQSGRLPAGADALPITHSVRGLEPPSWQPVVDDPDPVAYIVYTSGSTGRPKGVMVAQSSLCNFIRTAADCYGYRASDRVYQGLTIAFDFSVEEIWVPLFVGATLVPRPAGPNLVGADLHRFLVDRSVTALCCVPTLLSTVLDPVPSLRLLLVSGEACPTDLADRWLDRGVRMLNVYGPTEATVSATWTVLQPGERVTIGEALPTYTVFVVDPESRQPLPAGQIGELAIAGPGVALGYLNRPDLTERAFVSLELPSGEQDRCYLTGDLARVNDDHRIEYLGRADDQVKLRGYRIELAEIETVLLDVPGITAAAATTVVRNGAVVDLAAWVCCSPEVTDTSIFAALQEALPAYMVPAYLDRLPRLPVTNAGKLDRAALPRPVARRHVDSTDTVLPRTATEKLLAVELAAILDVERVSVDADFFSDLRADSLLMAAFCAQLRSHAQLPPVGIRDPYLHRTVATLAAHLDSTPLLASPQPAAEPDSAPQSVSALRYAVCGLLQAGYLLGLAAALGAGAAAAYDWTVEADGLHAFARMALGAIALCVGLCLGPVAVKWLLVGRASKRRTVPLWSATYLRWWAARVAIRISPLGLLTGTGLQVGYLRLLGASIGRGVVYLSRQLPSVPDQVRIGDGAVISKDVHLAGYVVDRVGVQIAPIEIGAHAYIGAGSALDIDTAIGERGQLAHASALLCGQRIPAGERWHGSPARPTVDVLRALPDDFGVLPRRTVAATLSALALLLAAVLVVGVETGLARWLDPANANWERYCLLATLIVAAAYPSLLFIRAIVACLTPRILRRWLDVDRVYARRGSPLLATRLLTVAGHSRSLGRLLGDSSYVVPFARLLGYDIDGTEQTGSTFGLEFQHDLPHLVSFGARSMASDGLSMLNVETTATQMRLRRSAIGSDCYLGNTIAVPPGVALPDNCLVGTKTMLPACAELRSGVGLLGSPAFEIPRTVARDTTFDALKAPEVRRQRLRAKNRHNLVTMALAVTAHIGGGIVALLALIAVVGMNPHPSPARAAAATAAVVVVEIAYAIAVERASLLWRRLTPQFHSIYDRRFWQHERMWKLSSGLPLALLDGTALKPIVWRLLGARVGKRLYDGGCSMPEKSLVEIGDDCVLGEQSGIQCHSLEDATFKSGRTVLGDRCVVADRALVHYDVRLGDEATIRCDAFVMKGERVPPAATWEGNPATAQ